MTDHLTWIHHIPSLHVLWEIGSPRESMSHLLGCLNVRLVQDNVMGQDRFGAHRQFRTPDVVTSGWLGTLCHFTFGQPSAHPRARLVHLLRLINVDDVRNLYRWIRDDRSWISTRGSLFESNHFKDRPSLSFFRTALFAFPFAFSFPQGSFRFLAHDCERIDGGAISKSSPVVIRFGWLAEEVGKAGWAMNRGGSSTRTSGARETVGPSRKVLSWEEYPSSRWADQGCPISSIKILEESTFLISPNLTWLFDTSNQKRSAILETYQDKLKLGINYQNENYLRRSIKKKEKRTT